MTLARDAAPLLGEAANLGASLRLAREIVARATRSLARVVDPEVAELLSQLDSRIAGASLKIAVLGQMNAGKSSFINALVGRPDLLPTNVNPWTAVVTRVHFGHPSGRRSGGRFEFFSEGEWRELAEGTSRLRLEQDRLVERVDRDLYLAQLTEVRARALCQLGPAYRKLLGTTHDVARLEPHDIERFVTAGGEGGEASSRLAGLAEITSSADVYCEPWPFSLPVSVIDTPGTNDPFLVREEVTLRSIESIDVAVLVVSARQAMTAADLGLLRAVRALHKDSLLVFVNRCDELETPDAGDVIVAHLRRLLESQFGVSIPIVLGSALLAEIAGRLAGGDPASVPAATIDRLVRGGRLRPEDAATFSHEAEAATRQRLALHLLQASGLPEVYAEISRVSGHSVLARQLASSRDALHRVAAQQDAIVRDELRGLEHALKQAHYDFMSDGAELERLRGAGERIVGTIARLESAAAGHRAEIERTQRQGLEATRARLLECLSRHVDTRRAHLMELLDRQKTRGAAARFDTKPLYRELEQTFVAEYRALYLRLVNIQLTASRQFRSLVGADMPGTELQLSVVSGSFPYPSLTALARTTAFDVDPRIWSRWRASQKSLAEAVDTLAAMIKEEFGRIVDELIATVVREITGPACELQSHLLFCFANARRTAERRHGEIVLAIEAIEQRRAPVAAERVLADGLASIAASRERLQAVTLVLRELEAAAAVGTPEALMVAAE